MRLNLGAKIRGFARLALRSENRADAYHEMRRCILGEPNVPAGELRRFLVLCHGNICRSPYAASLLSQALPVGEVVSTGLFASGGDAADSTAVAVARDRGICLEGHHSASTSSGQVEWADVILVMEGRQAREAVRRWPSSKNKIRVLGHYLSRRPFSIQDPWGQPNEAFERAFDQLDEAVSRFALLVGRSTKSETE